MDSCCFNRPYDDQSQLRISLETQAKLYIQDLVKKGKADLVTSYVLWYENSENPFEIRKMSINEFIQENSIEYIDVDQAENIKAKAEEIMSTGVKVKDAYHVACAIHAKCDYFFTTDDRLLKYNSEEIQILNPIDYVRREEK